MKFKKDDLKDIIGNDHADAEQIKSRMVGQRRWVTEYEHIFLWKPTGQYFVTYYDSGSTENCDTRPYEFEGDEIEVTEVFRTEVTVIKYLSAEEVEKRNAKTA